MIAINDLKVRLGGKVILDGLTWNIRKGARASVLGENGAGKTTLFRALIGEIEPERGSISIPGNVRTAYLPQELTDEFENISLMEHLRERSGIGPMARKLNSFRNRIEEKARSEDDYLSFLKSYEKLHEDFERADGYAFDSRAARVLKGLGFSEEDLHRQCPDFSGGWKMRIELASLLLCSPDTLLLDEPTNHLDTESMEWLENWLSGFSGTMVVISHDRRFLDKMTNESCELRSGRIKVYKGNFSSYLKLKEEEAELSRRIMDKQQREIRETTEFIERFRYKASKASQVQSRIKKLERSDSLPETPTGNKHAVLRFPEARRSGLKVFSTKNISKTYEGKTVFAGLDLTITRGDKVALVGVNGAGKSTLSRLIAKAEKPTSGEINWGYNVKTSFYSQESSKNLDHSKTIWEEILHCGQASEQEKRNLLGAFLFSGEDIYKPVNVLSGGEKSRLSLLKILLQDSNFLILDEPTNHLDMKTRELFQKALMEYKGTLVIVSHDRFFLDKLVNRVMEIRDGCLFDYAGNYSYFIEKRSQAMDSVAEIQDMEKGARRSEETPRKAKKRKEAEERNELYRKRKTVLVRLEPVEERINELEKEIERIDELLCKKTVISDSKGLQKLMLERNTMERELESLFSQWEELMVLLEKKENEISYN